MCYIEHYIQKIIFCLLYRLDFYYFLFIIYYIIFLYRMLFIDFNLLFG